MTEKFKECTEKLKNLVSDVQGAPFPGTFNTELYAIWYEHIQSTVLDALEFLDTEIPDTTTAGSMISLKSHFRQFCES